MGDMLIDDPQASSLTARMNEFRIWPSGLSDANAGAERRRFFADREAEARSLIGNRSYRLRRTNQRQGSVAFYRDATFKLKALVEIGGGTGACSAKPCWLRVIVAASCAGTRRGCRAALFGGAPA